MSLMAQVFSILRRKISRPKMWNLGNMKNRDFSNVVGVEMTQYMGLQAGKNCYRNLAPGSADLMSSAC
jgi:hypothetical protein